MLAPTFMLMPARAGLLSSHGRCSSFDASADGYICGDGCGGILLAPHSPKQTGSRDDNVELVRGKFNFMFWIVWHVSFSFWYFRLLIGTSRLFKCIARILSAFFGESMESFV